MWNAVTYFENLQKKLKITSTDYKFCRVTGLDYLEGILSASPATKNFFAVDDTDDGVTMRLGGGYFQRRAIVVFILKKYAIGNQADRETKLNETRTVRDKLVARLLKDSNEVEELYFLDKNRIPYREVPGYFANGTCGIYFTINIQEPVSLVHNSNDWES